MKKKIFSIVLSLCMVVAMMPMASGFAWADETTSSGSGGTTPGSTIVGTAVENVTFTHTYDVQRHPGFPSKGQEVTLSSLVMPLDSSGKKCESAGKWKLTKVGTYQYAQNQIKNETKLANLKSIVEAVAGQYSGTDADTMTIHQLTKDGSHIAYGVVIAYNGGEGRALFIGDVLSGSGAGYFLSTKPETGSVTETGPVTVTMKAGEVASDMAKELSISLDKTGNLDFGSKNVGYTVEESDAKTVTITNVGNAETGELNISVSPETAFELGQSTVNKIAKGGSDTFTIMPRKGLPAGTYNATVTVSGTDLDPQSFTVSFTVNDNSTPITPPTPPVVHTHNYGEPTYVWADDYSTCTASKTCKDASCPLEEKRTITESGVITSAVKTPATYTSKGTTTYTATFTDSDFTTQTKDVDDIPQLVYVSVHSHNYSQHIASDRYKKSDATCLSPAVYYVSCICGAKGTATFENGEKGAHNYVDGKCTVCGEISKALAKSELSSDFKAVPTAEAMKVFWGKVEGAEGYDVYVQICGKKFTAKSITNVADGNATETVIKKINGKKIDLNRNYKIFIKAYKLVDGKKVAISKTVIAHSTSVKNAKFTNVKDITVSKNSYDLSVGTTANIVAHSVKADGKKQILGDNHVKEFRYASSNEAVATVSKSGKITALTAGNCEIYVYGINGSREVVEVTVK